MKKIYDVVIVGAGIAGCSLAYELKKRKKNLSVLVLDKNSPGYNADYGYRSVTKKLADKYSLKYDYKFKGLKIGTDDETHFTVNNDFCFVNYSDVCNDFLNKSKADFVSDLAIDVKNKTLITKNHTFNFNFLVDASGANFFLRNKFNLAKPDRFWVGITKVLKNEGFNDDFYYHNFSDSEYLEDCYCLGDKILHGDWAYLKEVDFSKIEIPEKTLYSKHLAGFKVERTFRSVIPCSFVPPLINKNMVSFGDSFGFALTSSAIGMKPILESSSILAKSLVLGDLNIFQTFWEKNHLDNYSKFLVSKFDGFNNSKIMEKIKSYPRRTEVIKKMASNPMSFMDVFEGRINSDYLSKLNSMFPKKRLIFQIYYYFILRARYFISKLLTKTRA